MKDKDMNIRNTPYYPKESYGNLSNPIEPLKTMMFWEDCDRPKVIPRDFSV